MASIEELPEVYFQGPWTSSLFLISAGRRCGLWYDDAIQVQLAGLAAESGEIAAHERLPLGLERVELLDLAGEHLAHTQGRCAGAVRSEEHTSELQSRENLV